jgi:hypothetical protein
MSSEKILLKNFRSKMDMRCNAIITKDFLVVVVHKEVVFKVENFKLVEKGKQNLI